MIIGLGSDLIDIRRIETILTRFGTRFLQRLFTAEEQERAARLAAPAASLAKRFAAKEACAKALGTGFGRVVSFREIGIVNLKSGQPQIVLTGGAAEQLRRITPKGYTPKLLVSLSDEPPLALATVIISAEKS